MKYILSYHERLITFSEGEPIKLPDNLESLPRAEHFPVQRHRWNTNEVNYNEVINKTIPSRYSD